MHLPPAYVTQGLLNVTPPPEPTEPIGLARGAAVWGYVGLSGGAPTETSAPPTACAMYGQGLILSVNGYPSAIEYTADVIGSAVVGFGGTHGVLGVGGSEAAVAGIGTTGAGVRGDSTSSVGVWGTSQTDDGVYGTNVSGAAGVRGDTQDGVGVVGTCSGKGLAGRFDGAVQINGALTLNGNVAGDVTIDGNLTSTGSITTTGDVSAYDVKLTGGDLAEDFHSNGDAEIEPGTVMVIADEGEALSRCATAYDRRVAGVVSGAGDLAPGIVLDSQRKRSHRVTVAMAGKVYCKVDAQYGAIGLGDLLTTSPTPGHAMKVTDASLAFGSVLGKALRSLGSGRGLVPMLIALQ